MSNIDIDLFYRRRESKRKTHYKNCVSHIYNRGVAKSEIFLDRHDYVFYINLLKKTLLIYSFELYYYCFMPNHLHLCVCQLEEATSSVFIHMLHTQYVTYFNKKYERVGPLFQSRFKQTVVDSDAAFVYVGKYIHLNPVDAGLVEKPEDYPWSSATEYLLNVPGLCNKERLFSYFNDIVSYRKYLEARPF